MGLNQTIQDITHISDSTNSMGILDHFVTSDCELYAKTGVIIHGATDHFIIYGTRKKDKVDHPKDMYTGRAYGKLDKNKFKYDIIQHNWDHIYNNNDPEIAWELFKRDFIKILDKHAPHKFFNTRADKKPWVTTEFLESANERDNLSRMAKSRGCPVLKEQHWKARNRVVSLKREFKRHFFRNSINDAKGDSSKLWKVLKRFIKNNNTREKILSIHNKECPLDIANEINHYFVNIGSTLAGNIRASALELDYTPNPETPVFHLVETSLEEVEKQLMAISDSKATGEDGIPIRFLKMTKNITTQILCHIINRSLITNIVPLEWKFAVITPLFKEGDRSQANNYCPISILPAVSKILERIVHGQLYRHISNNNLLS